MLKNISSKALSTVVLILIVCYGFFRMLIREFYSQFVNYVLNLVGLNPERLTNLIKNFSKANIDSGLGWLLYYPSYFLLHILFIFLLFHKHKKVRYYLVSGLSGLIFFLVSMSIIGKYFNIYSLYIISYEAFQKLFGLPFILLFIEGGRILYKDVMNTNS